MAVCNKTGMIAVYNQAADIFFSPAIDGPGKFGEINGEPLRQISRFGRSFSVVKVPYSFKQLIQELQVINVQMRIITDDNADQLLNMCKSGNVNKLLDINTNTAEDFKILLDATNKFANNKRTNTNVKNTTIETVMEEIRLVPPVINMREPTKRAKPLEERPPGAQDSPIKEYIPNQDAIPQWTNNDWTNDKDVPDFAWDMPVVEEMAVPAVAVPAVAVPEEVAVPAVAIPEEVAVPAVAVPVIPAGYQQFVSKKGIPYYFNDITGKSYWNIEDIPVEPQTILTTVEEEPTEEDVLKQTEKDTTRKII